MNNINGFLLMISFFTRIPIGRKIEYTEERYLKGLKWFPFVGLIIGIFLVPVTFLSVLDQNIKGLLIALIYLFVTGGIHLDGLADSSDGLFSNRSKERVLEIMKDSHIGSFGVIALILYFLIFANVAGHLDWKWLILMPYIGKTMGFISASFTSYARVDHGMGYLFINNLKPIHACIHFIMMCAIVTCFLSFNGLIAIVISLFAMLLLIRFFTRVIDGQTGDTIGMVIEVSQIAFVLVGYVLN